MKVAISSVAEVAKNIDFIKRNNLNLVSIRDTSKKDNQHLYDIIDNANLENIFVTKFDDLEFQLNNSNYREHPPTEKDIIDIIEWAREKMVSNPTGFVVHCTAGVSRSSAVAILIKCLQDPDKALEVINPLLHSPNMLILDFGEKIFNQKGIKERVKKIEEENERDFLNNYDIRMIERKNEKI